MHSINYVAPFRRIHVHHVLKRHVGHFAPILITSEAKMEKLGGIISKNLPKNTIILLSGTLGAGKSVLVRGMVRELLGDSQHHVPSPTYLLVNSYTIPPYKIRGNPNLPHELHHFDLYRMPDATHRSREEALQSFAPLGYPELCIDNICIFEWPDRLGTAIPEQYVYIRIEKTGSVKSHQALQETINATIPMEIPADDAYIGTQSNDDEESYDEHYDPLQLSEESLPLRVNFGLKSPNAPTEEQAFPLHSNRLVNITATTAFEHYIQNIYTELDTSDLMH